MLDSVHLEIMLILMQDWCTVCTERTRRSVWRLLVSVQDRCTVGAKHSIGSETILDTLDGTPR
jgi:hypothetical protein